MRSTKKRELLPSHSRQESEAISLRCLQSFRMKNIIWLWIMHPMILHFMQWTTRRNTLSGKENRSRLTNRTAFIFWNWKHNRSLIGVVSQIPWCFYRLWRADIIVRPQVRILYVNEKEKRYKRNIMFLFAGHSDRLLSNNLEKQCFPRLLESYLHSS